MENAAALLANVNDMARKVVEALADNFPTNQIIFAVLCGAWKLCHGRFVTWRERRQEERKRRGQSPGSISVPTRRPRPYVAGSGNAWSPVCPATPVMRRPGSPRPRRPGTGSAEHGQRQSDAKSFDPWRWARRRPSGRLRSLLRWCRRRAW